MKVEKRPSAIDDAKCYAQFKDAKPPMVHDSSCTSSITPGFGARGVEDPAMELTRSLGGGSSFIQAFSSMLVHLPLVPA